jgi:choline dehydrogenase
LGVLQSFSFTVPFEIDFGSGTSEKVGEIAKSRGWKRALITTDKGVISAGLLKGVETSLDKNGIEAKVFDEVQPNPTTEIAIKSTGLLKETRADFVIGIGGGSSMDTAKTSAMLFTNGGVPQDYEVKSINDLLQGKVRKHPLPVITIPTTAGTGSEVDFWSVITDTKRKFKMPLGQTPLYPGAPYLGATYALIDPELTLSLPPRQTASTGIDALFHAIETYVAKGSPPLVEVMAPYIMETIAQNLPIAYRDGKNIEAREKMLFASSLAGICENLANCGAMHSLGEALGGVYDNIPHGICLAIFAPHVMRFNSQAEPEKFAKIAIALGKETDIRTIRPEKAALLAADALVGLMDKIDIPHSLREVGVKEDDIDEIVDRASQTAYIPDNPRTITREDFLSITRSAYEGTGFEEAYSATQG